MTDLRIPEPVFWDTPDADEGAVETLAVRSLPSRDPAYRTVDAQTEAT